MKRHENRQLRNQLNSLRDDNTELSNTVRIKESEINNLRKQEHEMIRNGSVFSVAQYNMALEDENDMIKRGYEEQIVTLKEMIRNMRDSFDSQLKKLAEDNLSEKLKESQNIIKLQAENDLYRKYYKLSPPPSEE